jgi:general secretion pathway protein A
MFLDYYHLREQPFGVTPDPRFLYLSQTHREALASLYYGVEAGRGFLALIAEPGMGKTTLLFQLMERVRKSACFGFLFQTQCDSREFLRYLLADMGIDSQGHDLVEMHEQLNAALMRLKRAGMRFVLVIDEAQNLDDSVLETVRLLSDFETPTSKLMQIILSGQPQLALKLARPALAQLRQRIAILSRLEPFSPAETEQYIGYRLGVAGYDGGPLFTSEATAIIAARSGGIPRNINNLCFNALSLGCALGRKKVDGEIVLEAVRDLDVELLAHMGEVPQGGSWPQPACHPERSEGSRPGSLPQPKADSSLRSATLRSAPLRMTCPPEGGTTCHPESSITCHPERSEGSPQSPLPPPPPAQPRSAPPLAVPSGLGHRPFRTAALAASVLACLLLFPSLWRSLGTQSDRVGAAGAMPLAKSTGLNRPTGSQSRGKSGSAACCAESLWLSGADSLPSSPRLGWKAQPSSRVEGVSQGGGPRKGEAFPHSRRQSRLGMLSLGDFDATPPAAQSTLVDRALSAAARTGNPTVIVVVKPRKTLYRICVEHFGRSDQKLLQQIQALNPRITDPNHIVTGQRIILPARTLKSPGTDSAARAGVEPMTSVRN